MVKIPQEQEYGIYLAPYYVMTLVPCLCWKEGSEFLEGEAGTPHSFACLNVWKILPSEC
jgi:hypothetical protein